MQGLCPQSHFPEGWEANALSCHCQTHPCQHLVRTFALLIPVNIGSGAVGLPCGLYPVN